MEKLRCTNCNYSFKPKAHNPNKCPYCEKEGTLEKHKDMQALIDEVVAESEEFESRE